MAEAGTTRETLLKRLEGIRDGWEAADAYGKGIIEITPQRGNGQTPSSIVVRPAFGSRAEGIKNAGAIFDTPAEAADALMDTINAQSVSQNVEHAWFYYRDPITGKYGYSDPYVTGLSGGAKIPVKLSVAGEAVPQSYLMGMGHTHGNYSSSSRN